MIQLTVLDGKQNGTAWVARQLPVTVGRGVHDSFRLEDHGVWDRHLEFRLATARRVELLVRPEAPTAIEGVSVSGTTPLANGDVIQLGAVRLRFGLSPTRQRSQRLRELLTWTCLALLSLGQIALVYFLLAQEWR